MLTGSTQKGCDRLPPYLLGAQGHNDRRSKEGAFPPHVIVPERGNSHGIRIRPVGSPQGETTCQGKKDVRESECPPVMGGIRRIRVPRAIAGSKEIPLRTNRSLRNVLKNFQTEE